MADGVILNSGSGGVTAATDDCGVAGHAQVVKLAISTDGSATAIPADATNGIDVDVTRVQGTVAVSNAGLTALNGAIAGSEVQVDVVGALPAGTNNIGDVDVLTLPSTTLAGATKQELDYDTGAGTQNTPLVGVALPGAGGPVAGGTSTNPLRVDPTGSTTQPISAASLPLPTGAATSAKQDTAQTALDAIKTAAEKIDDPVATIGTTPLMRVAIFDDADTQITSFGGGTGSGNTEYTIDSAGNDDTDKVLIAGAYRKDTAASLVGTDGDRTALQVDSSGRLHVNGSGVTQPVSAASLPLPTGASTAAKQPALGTAGTASADVITIQGIASMTAVKTDGSGVTQPVSMATNTPVGNVAHDAADSGAPIKIGGRADTTFQTAVADGDRVDALFDVYGQQRTRRDHVNLWSYHDDDAAAVTTDGTVQSAPGAGLSVYITDLVFSIGAATASSIFVEEGTSKILGPYYLEAVAGRSIHIKFDTPKKCTANTAILVTNTGSISFSVDMLGFIAP